MQLVLVLVLSLPFLFIVARRRVLRRLALRNAVRRPREAMFVVLGSLFGTAIITGSLVVGDTIDSSIRSLAYTRLGPADELVVTQDANTFSEARARVEALDSDLVDGTFAFSALQVATAAGAGDDQRAVPRSQIVELDFEAGSQFGGDPAITGLDGPTPPTGAAAITEELADQLDAGPGDQIRVFAYGGEQVFSVDRIVESRGLTGFTTGFFNQRSRNVLVAPGTLDQLAAGAAAPIAEGRFAAPDRIVAVSNRGGVEDGAVHTDEVVRLLTGALDGLGVHPVEAKADILEEAEDDSAVFQELFTAMGAFGILAGVLLLVNIFVMLGEERKQELGMLRAVGLRRASLVGAFSTEGWLYSLLAAALGTLVGLGLGRVIILLVERIFESDVEGFGLPLRFNAEGASLQGGFAAGFAIAVVTVLLTSVRISRFNVIQAIRDLPEQRRRRTGLTGLVVGAVAVAFGGTATAASFTGEAPALRLVGPVVLATGLGVLLNRFVPRRGLVTAVSAAVLVWGAVIFPLSSALGEAGIQVFVIQGVVLTTAAVVLVSQEHDAFAHVSRRLGAGGWAMATRLGLAYPVARRFRTGLTLAMYSLVIFTLTFITTLTATFTNQIDETTRMISGGYDVFVRSNPSNPAPVEEVASLPGVAAAAPVATVEVRFIREGTTEPQDWSITGYDQRWLDNGPPELADRGEYATDLDAYRAVLADPSLILVDQFFLTEGGGPPDFRVDVGEALVMIDPRTGSTRELTVVAQAADDFLFNGAIYGMPAMLDFFGPRAVFNRAYVEVEGASAPDVAAAISGRFLASGAEADPIRDLLAEFIAVQNQFFQLFRGYLGFGLLVGIAGLGVVMVRAVRERRREIGVLRSLGFQSRTVRRSFVLEATFVAMEGTLIGVVLALVTAFNVMSNTEAFGEHANFIIPWGGLAGIILGTLVASLLATAAPTRAAARIRPAVALRIAD